MKRLIANKFFAELLKRLSAYPVGYIQHAFLKLLEVLEKQANSLITYHFRPARASMFLQNDDESRRHHKDVAIVLQGGLIYNDDFTLETLRIYKKLFPGCAIILSTWKDEKPETLEQCRAEGVYLVLNEKPAYFGTQNINLQIVSTKGGLDFARSLQCNYLVKTRTDQRIYDKNAISLFKSLISAFPLAEVKGQKQRLIATNLITAKYRYYGLSDMLMFGDSDDMNDYWDVPLDMRRDIASEEKTYTIKDHAKLRLGEMYFLTNFIERKESLKWTLEHTWNVYGERFCIIDFNMIGLYWDKYDRRDDNKYNFYNSVHSLQRLSFADWLSFYNKSVVHVPEEYMDKNMGSVLLSN